MTDQKPYCFSLAPLILVRHYPRLLVGTRAKARHPWVHSFGDVSDICDIANIFRRLFLMHNHEEILNSLLVTNGGLVRENEPSFSRSFDIVFMFTLERISGVFSFFFNVQIPKASNFICARLRCPRIQNHAQKHGVFEPSHRIFSRIAFWANFESCSHYFCTNKFQKLRECNS